MSANDKQGARKDESSIEENDSAHFNCPLEVKFSRKTRSFLVDQLHISGGIKSCPLEED